MHINDPYYAYVPFTVSHSLTIQAVRLVEALRREMAKPQNQLSVRYKRLSELRARATERFFRRVDTFG